MLLIHTEGSDSTEIEVPWLDKIGNAIVPHINPEQAPVLTLLLVFMLVKAIKEAPPDIRTDVGSELCRAILDGVRESLT